MSCTTPVTTTPSHVLPQARSPASQTTHTSVTHSGASRPLTAMRTTLRWGERGGQKDNRRTQKPYANDIQMGKEGDIRTIKDNWNTQNHPGHSKLCERHSDEEGEGRNDNQGQSEHSETLCERPSAGVRT